MSEENSVSTQIQEGLQEGSWIEPGWRLPAIPKDENSNCSTCSTISSCCSSSRGSGSSNSSSSSGSSCSSISSDDKPLLRFLRKPKFIEGVDVLARWSDGLLYLGTVAEVDNSNCRCSVKFEDGSQYWVLYKDLQKGPPTKRSEIVCNICSNGTSEPPNQIVICDQCNQGYHQLCHVPQIGETFLQPEVPWLCRNCIFARAAKKGGAEKQGALAQAMQVMKQTLPYDLKSLTWDAHHRVNTQQCYCYCGGPGEWHMKMLKCCRCKQWFHEACLQCLNFPLLYGDRFYVFICGLCNGGHEYVYRLNLKWADLAHLVLFNLAIEENKKYFDIDSAIVPFLDKHWEEFQTKDEMASTPSLDRREKLLSALQGNKRRFMSGKEIKKRTTLWGLRTCMPPPQPSVSVPTTGIISDASFMSQRSNGRRARNCRLVNGTTAKSKRLLRKSANTAASNAAQWQPSKAASLSVLPDSQKATWEEDTPSKKAKTTACKMKDSPKKNYMGPGGKCARYPPVQSQADVAKETVSSWGTLETIIPRPSNFEGSNHPFCSPDRPQSHRYGSGTSAKRKANGDLVCDGEGSRHRRKCSRHAMRLDRPTPDSDGSRDTGSDPENLDGRTSIRQSATRTAQISPCNPKPSLGSYFDSATKERFRLLARRVTQDGQVQYLVEWEGKPL